MNTLKMVPVIDVNVHCALIFCFFSIAFDIRVTPTADLVALEEKIKQWCEDAGEGVTYTFLQVSRCSLVNKDTFYRLC